VPDRYGSVVIAGAWRVPENGRAVPATADNVDFLKKFGTKQGPSFFTCTYENTEFFGPDTTRRPRPRYTRAESHRPTPAAQRATGNIFFSLTRLPFSLSTDRSLKHDQVVHARKSYIPCLRTMRTKTCLAKTCATYYMLY
jgi:hypothetical protein